MNTPVARITGTTLAWYLTETMNSVVDITNGSGRSDRPSRLRQLGQPQPPRATRRPATASAMCAGRNCGRSRCRINTAWILAWQMPFTELLRFLENDGAVSHINAAGIPAGLPNWCAYFGERPRDDPGQVAAPCRWMGPNGHGSVGIYFRAEGADRRFLPGLLTLVLRQPTLQQSHRGAEVIAEGQQQVDVVQVFLAAEAVGQVVRGLTVARISPQCGQTKRK